MAVPRYIPHFDLCRGETRRDESTFENVSPHDDVDHPTTHHYPNDEHSIRVLFGNRVQQSSTTIQTENFLFLLDRPQYGHTIVTITRGAIFVGTDPDG